LRAISVDRGSWQDLTTMDNEQSLSVLSILDLHCNCMRVSRNR
jgi:hypothetical protein